MLNRSYIISKVKKLLPIDDTDLYDEELEIYVGGAISKLESEGISNVFDADSDQAFDYIICISYQIALEMNLITDYNRLYSQYITRVVTLRAYLANQVSS